MDSKFVASDYDTFHLKVAPLLRVGTCLKRELQRVAPSEHDTGERLVRLSYNTFEVQIDRIVGAPLKETSRLYQ